MIMLFWICWALPTIVFGSDASFLARRTIMSSAVRIECQERSKIAWWPWGSSSTDEDQSKASDGNKAAVPANWWEQYGITPEGQPISMGSWSTTGFSEEQQ